MQKIHSYSFGRIQIGNQTYTNDLILTPSKLYTDWWRDQGHYLQIQDLKIIDDPFPEILIIGTGANGRMEVSPEVLKWLENEIKIQVEVKPSAAAVELYNTVVSHEKKKVGLAIHLTC